MTGTKSTLSPVEPTETPAMGGVETTWGPCGDYGDNVGTMGMTLGQRGQCPCCPHCPQWRQWRPQPWGCGDHMWTLWGLWGQRGPHGDNEITKNAVSFEQIEIIECRLKIWDP